MCVAMSNDGYTMGSANAGPSHSNKGTTMHCEHCGEQFQQSPYGYRDHCHRDCFILAHWDDCDLWCDEYEDEDGDLIEEPRERDAIGGRYEI